MPAGSKYAFPNQSGKCGLHLSAVLAHKLPNPVGSCHGRASNMLGGLSHADMLVEPLLRYLKDRPLSDSLWANDTSPTENTGKLDPDELR
eukprot:1146873-Pelagomonas_calceolata.AAC.2